MIIRLSNDDIDIANEIHSVFQASYAVEAQLLKAVDFPPLRRPIKGYLDSDNLFFGYIMDSQLTGVIEIEHSEEAIDINSLVIHPAYFKRGIASQLLAYIFEEFDAHLYTVETGIDNLPATQLYQKHGFIEIKQWDTNFGIRKVKFERRLSV